MPQQGSGLVRWSWRATVLFSATAIAAAVKPSWFQWPAVVVALTLFGIGIVVMLWAFLTAVERSRVDAIGVGGLFFGMGSTPIEVRAHLLGALMVQTVTGIATAAVRPFTSLAFGTLVPVLAIGTLGLWSARHGEFERTDPEPDE